MARPAPAPLWAGLWQALPRTRRSVFMLAGLAVVPLLLLWQTARLTAVGYQLQDARQVRDYTLQEVYRSEVALARLQSLPVVERAAREQLKMVPAERYLTIRVEEPHSEQSPTDLVALPVVASPPPAQQESLWRVLRRALDRFLP